MVEMTANQREKLMADLRLVVTDAEELLRLTADNVGESARGMRERMQQRLVDARDALAKLQDNASERARAAGRAADEYVHENPWRSIAIGTGFGLLVGMLISRR